MMLSAVVTRGLARVAVRELTFLLPSLIKELRFALSKRRMPVYLRSESARLPSRAYPRDAGLDLSVSEDFTIEPFEVKMVPTSVSVELPRGTFGYVTGRSSWGKRGLWVFQGTIDEGYRGEIGVVLCNLSGEPISIMAGTKIAQMIILPFVHVKPELRSGESRRRRGPLDRGTRGFGSSGL